MEISFDPAKDAANIQERGIPLAFGAVILARAVGELEDTRKDYGEDRLRAFAEVEGKWFQCVCTARGFWDTGLNPMPPDRRVEAASVGRLLAS